MTQKEPKFVVDADGFRELQEGRKPWQLAKELIANAFDEESVTDVQVTVRKGSGKGKKLADFIVEDDGEGFADLRDAWTIWAHTPKRFDPNVRGRFNLGEKEIMVVAHSGILETTTGMVVFEQDGRTVNRRRRRDRGTVMSLKMRWTKDECEEVERVLKSFLPPNDIRYTVNGDEVPYRKPHKSVHTRLETVLLEEGALRTVYRTTDIHVHKPLKDETPMIMEMGIPVQENEAPYHFDVQQKVPMNPNRDAVKPGYVKDLCAEILNVVADEVDEEDASEAWVRDAVSDPRSSQDAVKTVMTKRFGEKTRIASTDTGANERARDAGYTVIGAKSLSKPERERFAEVGMSHTTEEFGFTSAQSEHVEPTSDMERFADFVKRLGKEILGFTPKVRFHKLSGSSVCAQWGNRAVSFNVVHFADYEWNGITPRMVGIVLHEFAHEGGFGAQGEPHDKAWKDRLEAVAGKAVLLALAKPKVFE